MRGSQATAPDRPQHLGSIPASAGQPDPVLADAVAGRVYPRECGAAAHTWQDFTMSAGLSPRVRGSLPETALLAVLKRSIPASAGQPGHRPRSPTAPGVYPRECGAACRCPGALPARCGLSPRVRGSRIQYSLTLWQGGSIPASAGQPLTHGRTSPCQPVYPRECGAATPSLFPSFRVKGLSPRVRGSLIENAFGIARAGSIPASAGQPAMTMTARWMTPVYPRECGAAIAAIYSSVLLMGLSPRVRGSRHECAAR